MKTVLVVTGERSHRLIYESALRRHYRVQISPGAEGSSGRVHAIVYDMPSGPRQTDLRWLECAGMPVVALTCDERVALPEAPNLRVLTYPVQGAQVLRALSDLGVTP